MCSQRSEFQNLKAKADLRFVNSLFRQIVEMPCKALRGVVFSYDLVFVFNQA